MQPVCSMRGKRPTLRHVWTPRETQEESSGLMKRVVRADMCAASTAAHMPRARMGVRGSGPIQNHVLDAPVAKLVFLIPSR